MNVRLAMLLLFLEKRLEMGRLPVLELALIMMSVLKVLH